MTLLDYQHLAENRATKVKFGFFAKHFPWCFTSDYFAKKHHYGIAPIIGVTHIGSEGVQTVDRTEAFIGALVVQPNLLTSKLHKYSSPLQIRQNLRNTIQTSNEWLWNNFPLWLKNAPPPVPSVVLLQGASIQHVDGGSAGLSTLLATISQLLQEALPVDWIYSATISHQGNLGPVNSILEKAKGVRKLAPRIKHLALGRLPPEAQSLIQDIEELGLTVHQFTKVQDALSTIPIGSYPSIQAALEASLENLVSQDSRLLQEFVDNIFLSSLQGLNQIYGWGSLYSMLIKLQRNSALWKKLSTQNRLKIEITTLIAYRYTYAQIITERPPIPLQFLNEHLDFLQQLPVSEQHQLLPHLVQQITDCPDSIDCISDILTLVQHRLPDLDQEWILPLQLKLLGSWGRYLSKHQKEYQTAYTIQKQCFHHWCKHGLYYEASYPLSAMMYLHEQLPHTQTEVQYLWDSFTKKPGSNYMEIIRFLPDSWKKVLMLPPYSASTSSTHP